MVYRIAFNILNNSGPVNIACNPSQVISRGERNRKRFNWESRMNIVMGIARALAYLHEEVVPYIVHRDIKASNILLDRNFNPKVSDIGLSRQHYSYYHSGCMDIVR